MACRRASCSRCSASARTARLGCLPPSCVGPWWRRTAAHWRAWSRSTGRQATPKAVNQPAAAHHGRSSSGWVGRSHDGKRLVVGAIEVTDGKPGRLRLQAIADYSAQTLHAFVVQALAAGSTAKTDGWVGYPGAPGVTHDPHVVGPMAAHVMLPWIHTVFANLKIWAKGVYHCLRGPHLQTYLDEFVFRFNRRRTPHAAFRSLLTIAAAVHPVPYKMLIAPEASA